MLLYPAFEIKKNDLNENGLETNQYFHRYFLVPGTSSQFKHTLKHTKLRTLKEMERNTDSKTIFLYHTPNDNPRKKGDLKLKKKVKKKCS